VKIGIIGSGITGAVLGNLLPEAIVYERATHVGGRTTTRFLKDTEQFDIGATVFKEKIGYIEKGIQKEFDFLDFLRTRVPDLKVEPHKTHPGSFHPISCMQDLSASLLSKNTVELLHHAESITKSSDQSQWILKFNSGKTELFDKIILTAPVPQIISLLKNSGHMTHWDEAIRFRGEYRSSLVLTGIWRNLPSEIIQKVKAQKNFTLLFKDEDAEYISIESEKYRKNDSDHSLIITIQFSSAFSSKNLERWCDAEKKPMYYILNSNQYFFNRVFHVLDIPEMISKKPDQIDTHKWRYSQADFALFKDTDINLDHPKLLEYMALSKKHNLWMTGDWIWGSRIVRCALGATVIAKEILKESMHFS
jgi:predicted NAD/FAD-dependent oxidoreductase